MPALVQIDAVSHRYGNRLALDSVSFSVDQGEVFGLLGPNGGGKTTLFRILTTWMRPDAGRATICKHDVVTQPGEVRRVIGVVFQHASLDGKLTVRENLLHQGHLYGLSGLPLADRIREMLERFGVADRMNDRVETLSGGLARRVDLAKGLLHRPKVLLLDEPSTGLDPKVRWEVWRYLDEVRRSEQLTVLMTTHFMDEAQRCDRVGIIDAGRLVAVGPPDELKSAISGDCLTLEVDDPAVLVDEIQQKFQVSPRVLDGQLRIEHDNAHQLIPRFVEAFGDRIRSISLSKPTLEEVFIHHTGRRFEEASDG